MLGRLRTWSVVRTAVCLAALLSLAGAAGLHPEPAGSPVRGGQRGFTAGPHHGAVRETPHLCQVCALYFTCSLAPAGSNAPTLLPAGAPIPSAWSSFCGRIEGRLSEGRAPPLTF